MQLAHGLLDGFRDLQSVAPGGLVDAQGHRAIATLVGVDPVVLGAQFHPPHIGHPRDAALSVALDDDLRELIRRGQLALCLNDELLGRGTVGEGRGSDRARGDLQVVVAQGVDDLLDRQIASGGLVRVDPDPHRIVARRVHPDIPDAWDAQQSLPDLQARVVRQKLPIQRRIGCVHVDDQQRVAVAFADGNAEVLDLLRQLRQRGLHAVLNFDLRDVNVRAQLEGDRDAHTTLADRLRGDVEHVIHAVDLLLQRGCDVIGHDLGGSAGVGRRHGHRWRRNARILVDGQVGIGDRTQQRNDDRDRAGEHRSIDKEVGDLHAAIRPGGPASSPPTVIRQGATAGAHFRPGRRPSGMRSSERSVH